MEMILQKIPGPEVDVGGPLQMLVTTLDWSDYVGRIAIGRVQSGTIRKGQSVVLMQAGDKITPSRVVSVYLFQDLGRTVEGWSVEKPSSVMSTAEAVS